MSIWLLVQTVQGSKKVCYELDETFLIAHCRVCVIKTALQSHIKWTNSSNYSVPYAGITVIGLIFCSSLSAVFLKIIKGLKAHL